MNSTINSSVRRIHIDQDITTKSNIDRDMVYKFRQPHQVEFGAFLIIGSGEATLHINLSEYRLCERTFATILPGSIIFISDMSDDFNFDAIAFSRGFTQDGDVVRNIFRRLESIIKLPVVMLESNESIWMQGFYSLFRITYNRISEHSTAYISIITNMLETLFCVISAIYDRYRSITPSKVLTRKEEIVHNYAQLVLKHYDKERSVGFYADKLCITSTYLNALVKEVRGETASQIITNAVILYAKSRLKDTTDTVQQISDQLNFPNSSFFAKYFKREVGMSPSEYRNLKP
ncbi:MAG: AraC family transcriptional regulator [Alistipes sp.]|nr:AraC family transcriptional regulator [Alistipes sp.]